MIIGELIEAVRKDYFDDDYSDNLWPDDFMFRSFREAERQACNRAHLIYDGSSRICQFKLIDGKSDYNLDQKITFIKYVGLADGREVRHKSEDELNRQWPGWRGMTGFTRGHIGPWFLVRGRTLTVVPAPAASKDATFIQDAMPLAYVDRHGNSTPLAAGMTWYTGGVLNEYDGANWSAKPNAVLATLKMEVYRLPLAAKIDESYEPEIPEENHRDLIYWVLHEAYKKQDADTFDQERSDYFLARFTEIFGEYVPAKVRINQFEENQTFTARPVRYEGRNMTFDEWGEGALVMGFDESDLKKALNDILDGRAKIGEETHNKHHAFIDALIEKEQKRAKLLETVASQILQWGVLGLLAWAANAVAGKMGWHNL